MALAKYAEDNLEIFYERTAMKEQSVRQNSIPLSNKIHTIYSQNNSKEIGDSVRTIFAGKSYLLG